MLAFVLHERHAGQPTAWAARRMWALDAADVRAAFKDCRSLTGSLVKQLRKRGWTTDDTIAAAYQQIIAEHGPPEWPGGAGTTEPAGLVPAAPFVAWLDERKDSVGSYRALADRTGLNPDRISQWLRGKQTGRIRRATVDRALASFDDGSTFTDIYGGGR